MAIFQVFCAVLLCVCVVGDDDEKKWNRLFFHLKMNGVNGEKWKNLARLETKKELLYPKKSLLPTHFSCFSKLSAQTQPQQHGH